MKYEVIREIFNQCSNNQMRDVFVLSVDTDNPRKWLEDFLSGKEVKIEESYISNEELVFDVYISNLHQRFSFSKDE